MADKPGILRNLRIKRVALVDNGANLDKSTGDGAHIMLFKRDVSKGPSLGEVHIDSTDIKVKPKPKEKDVKKSMFDRMLGLFKETDVAKRDAEIAEIAKAFPPDDDADDKVHKGDDPMCKCADCVSMRAKKLDKLAVDEIEREKVAKAALEAAEKAKVAPEMQKRFDALEAENVALRKSVTDATAIAKAERDARLDNEMRDVLKGFRATPFDLDSDVKKFRKMKEDAPDIYERTMAILKATDAQLAASTLFGDIGTRKGTGEGSAWAQIEAKADTLVEKSTDGKLTHEQAVEKVMMANPKLVAQYRAETNGSIQ